MNPADRDDGGPEIRPDVIAVGPPDEAPRRWPVGAGALAVALLVGALAGYVAATGVGDIRVPGTRAEQRTATPAPSRSTLDTGLAPGTRPVVLAPPRCSVQVGDRLQLGVQIINRSARVVRLRGLSAVLPRGGLRPTGSSWGACGELSSVPDVNPYEVSAGAAAWMTITLQVLRPCPAPTPVQFRLTYTHAGEVTTVNLGGFPDLDDVPYTGCRPPAR